MGRIPLHEEQPILRIAALAGGSLRATGGYEVFAGNLLGRLAERGHKVDLYIPYLHYRKDKTHYQAMPFGVHSLPSISF